MHWQNGRIFLRKKQEDWDGVESTVRKPKKKWDFFVGKNSIKDSVSVCYWSSHTLLPCYSLSRAAVFTGKTSLLASYAQRNQLLQTLSRPRWPHGHWSVCLPIHLAKVNMEHNAASWLKRNFNIPVMWLKRRENKKMTNKRSSLLAV